MNIVFFGSSLVSSYWNGAATYYRGLLKALAAQGHAITFYEPDALDRQAHRDIGDPEWARVVVYPATEQGWQRAVAEGAKEADLLVKTSGIGVFDSELAQAVPEVCKPGSLCFYWDVDAPVTLDEIDADPTHHLRRVIPRYDAVMTYGGGEPVVSGYRAVGAKICVPIYNALDPETHYPTAPRDAFRCDLSFLGNRLPDREARVEQFLLTAASLLPDRSFLLGGSGWADKPVTPNVRAIGHVGTADHNALFASGMATLNINRNSMASYGFSPPTRVFEAVGAGACLITDAWVGVETFLEPGKEVLVAHDGAEVADHVARLTPDMARDIAAAARAHVLAHHTYAHRARQVCEFLDGMVSNQEAAE
jgi:spore maturation protein CgeB